jgi:hypothetical protein
MFTACDPGVQSRFITHEQDLSTNHNCNDLSVKMPKPLTAMTALLRKIWSNSTVQSRSLSLNLVALLAEEWEHRNRGEKRNGLDMTSELLHIIITSSESPQTAECPHQEEHQKMSEYRHSE